ncbi:DUF6234 family protein [Streptomyces sp. NBC_01465]|uniref:DUF6234 family protein n=1 Tax=Streptomyces sp. NBC_01465 TaxID=2903878 RepID=UPI002E337A5F|nr:DUF6234 family protein [Streptomyces sp. NBC_01465]
MSESVSESERVPFNWPWSRRTALTPDLVVGISLLLLEAAAFIGVRLGSGMSVWVAEWADADTASVQRASIRAAEYFLLTTLAFVVLAVLARAPWTIALQLLAAVTLAVLLAYSQHAYDQSHPRPAPTPGPNYQPCYSGSGTCD